jgi:hypothetical protein
MALGWEASRGREVPDVLDCLRLDVVHLGGNMYSRATVYGVWLTDLPSLPPPSSGPYHRI